MNENFYFISSSAASKQEHRKLAAIVNDILCLFGKMLKIENSEWIVSCIINHKFSIFIEKFLFKMYYVISRKLEVS